MKNNPGKNLQLEPLEALLRNLPRENASPGFAARTIFVSRNRRIWHFPRPFMAIATFVLVGAGLMLGVLNFFKPTLNLTKDKTTEQADLEALALLQEMNRELQAIQTEPSWQQPYLRVQGAAQKAYFIDLRSFAQVAGETAYANFKPTRTF